MIARSYRRLPFTQFENQTCSLVYLLGVYLFNYVATCNRGCTRVHNVGRRAEMATNFIFVFVKTRFYTKTYWPIGPDAEDARGRNFLPARLAGTTGGGAVCERSLFAPSALQCVLLDEHRDDGHGAQSQTRFAFLLDPVAGLVPVTSPKTVNESFSKVFPVFRELLALGLSVHSFF